ncbi:MAG: hypothetical protein IRY94_16130 [Rhodospirillaceae bacterium]|nr:hypothetical protein [Rhodospirillaceae bacterium]
MKRPIPSLLAVMAVGLVLAAAPLAAMPGRPVALLAAFAKDNGGGHGEGSQGRGHGDHGRGSGGHGSAQGRGSGGGLGMAATRAHDADGSDDLTYGTALPSPDRLGRLNGFLHASEEGRLHAAPGSAVGIISHDYAEALAAYLDARQRIAVDPLAAVEAQEALDRAAAILGSAANKPLSPEIVALVNGQLVTAPFTDEELTEIADKANAQ